MKYIKLFESKESYNDYPAAAKANAKKAIEWKEKYGRDEVQGGTEVGWARAHQLAKGENLSADTVGRMSSFNRHRKNSKITPEHKDEPWKDNGYIAWLIWGGDEGVDWAIDKMKEIRNENKTSMKHIKLFEEFIEEKKGLWDNVWAKRKRGEKPAKPGDEDYPDEDAWKSAQSKK